MDRKELYRNVRKAYRLAYEVQHSIVEMIVTFAKKQHIQTIAEFVENEEIFHIVQALGIDYSQGYAFGKPELF